MLRKLGTKILPVIAIDKLESAQNLRDSLLEAGISTLEITLRTPVALKAIEQLSKDKRLTIIAGTIKNLNDLHDAKNAGAKFGISPGLIPELLGESDFLIPGVATPSEALLAYAHNFRNVKFFPANIFGGVGFLKAMHAILPELVFCPTGGIDLSNAKDFLSLPNVACVGSSAITAKLKNGDFDAIAKSAQEFVNVCN